MLLPSPRLAFLGPREEALAASTGGGWAAWGARGAWCDILPSFVAVSALLRAELGIAWLTLGQGLGRRDGEKETRGWGGQGYPACSSGAHGAQGMCRGLRRESGPTSSQTRLFIIPKAAGFSVCPVSPWRWDCRQGERQEWDAV